MGRQRSEQREDADSRLSGHSETRRVTRAASKRRKCDPQPEEEEEEEEGPWSCPPQDVFDVLCARFCARNIVAMQLVSAPRSAGTLRHVPAPRAGAPDATRPAPAEPPGRH